MWLHLCRMYTVHVRVIILYMHAHVLHIHVGETDNRINYLNLHVNHDTPTNVHVHNII